MVFITQISQKYSCSFLKHYVKNGKYQVQIRLSEPYARATKDFEDREWTCMLVYFTSYPQKSAKRLASQQCAVSGKQGFAPEATALGSLVGMTKRKTFITVEL